MEKLKYFLYTMFLFALIAFSVSFISIHADAKTLQGDALSGATTRENFLKQGNAEIIVAGVSNYVNAGATPTTCAGGMPSGGLTVAREKSKAMSGDFYWKIVKSAGDQQGEGIAFGFTVDGFTSTEQVQQELYAKVKVIAGSFLFGTDTVSSDIGFYLYDVTASKLVTLGGGNDILGSEVKRWFTPTKDSTQYRLCVHVQTTATNAFTLGLDDLFAGKAQPVSTGDVENTFTAYISGAAPAIQRYTGPDHISGVSLSDTSLLTVTFKGLSEAPNCEATASSGDVTDRITWKIVGISKDSATIRTLSENTKAWRNIYLSCTRTGSDYIKGAELADRYFGKTIAARITKNSNQTVNVSGSATENITSWTIREDTVGIVKGDYVEIPVDGYYSMKGEARVYMDTSFSGLYIRSFNPETSQWSVITDSVGHQTATSGSQLMRLTTGIEGVFLKKGLRIYLTFYSGTTGTAVIQGGPSNVFTSFSIKRDNPDEQAFRPPMYNPADVTTDEVRVGTDWTVTPPKPIYKRCFVPSSDVTTNSTVATFASGLRPIDWVAVDGGLSFQKFLTGNVATDVHSRLIYTASSGIIQFQLEGTGGYVLLAGQPWCMKYLKP